MSPAILAVDDDPTVVKLLRMTLEGHGYRFDAVGSLSAARRVLHRGEHQMVILDLGLPDGNGLDLLRMARREMAIDWPVLILTSYHQEETVVLGLESGADDYLTKPFSTRELLARVNKRMRWGARPDVATQR